LSGCYFMECVDRFCREAENNDPEAVALLRGLGDQFAKLNAPYTDFAEYIEDKFRTH
jgi:hypothetical protein